MTEHTQPINLPLQFFCPRWGQEYETYDAFCRKVKEAGYDGIEAPVPTNQCVLLSSIAFLAVLLFL